MLESPVRSAQVPLQQVSGWSVSPIGHVLAVSHCPFEPHVSVLVVEAHPTTPGVHAAPHWPAVTEPLTQAVPAVLHVCGTAPLHPVELGVHTAPHWPPVIAPSTHAPEELHVSGTSPLHVVALGVQTAPQ